MELASKGPWTLGESMSHFQGRFSALLRFLMVQTARSLVFAHRPHLIVSGHMHPLGMYQAPCTRLVCYGKAFAVIILRCKSKWC